jgi:hypothetical protein
MVSAWSRRTSLAGLVDLCVLTERRYRFLRAGDKVEACSRMIVYTQSTRGDRSTRDLETRRPSYVFLAHDLREPPKQ